MLNISQIYKNISVYICSLTFYPGDVWMGASSWQTAKGYWVTLQEDMISELDMEHRRKIWPRMKETAIKEDLLCKFNFLQVFILPFGSQLLQKPAKVLYKVHLLLLGNKLIGF